MSQSIEDRIKELKPDMDKWKELEPFGQFKDGENTLQVDTSVPIQMSQSKYGKEQHIYVAILNNERVRISLPMTVEIPVLKGLAKKKVSFIVMKKGSGMQTRYKVK